MTLRFFLICFFISLSLTLTGQSVDPKSVDVGSLSDSQIERIATEITKRGLSESEAIALGRAKGLSQTQIDVLKRRLQDHKLGNSKGNGQTNNSTRSLNVRDSDLSQKAIIDSTLQAEGNRIFGFSFFNNDRLTFEPSINVPVSDDYILGPGDELVVDIWGASQQTYNIQINKQGDVTIPLLGPIHIGGISLGQAKKYIVQRLGSLYSDLLSESPRTFANVQMGKLKTIKVNVVGEVFTPGSYTLPGTASLFNVLYLAGGPNLKGSFRDVQLIRNGEVIANLDIYDFLINGNAGVNVSLMDNDVVMVPTYYKRVSLNGELKRPGVFEAKNNESVWDMIHYAGGFGELAYQKRIELYRIGKRERSFKNVFSDEFKSVTIMNGDSLIVGKVLDRYTNMVNISGAVFSPGNYEFTEGLLLSDLINIADGLTENAFLNRGIISRKKDDFTNKNIAFDVKEIIAEKSDILLKANDAVYIASSDSIREQRRVAIWGEVLNMGHYQYGEDMTLGDLVLLANGFKESASGSSIEVMRRLDYDKADISSDTTAMLYNFLVSRDLRLDDEGSNFKLEPFDEVFVRFMPGFRTGSVVNIIGEVMYSGNYGLASQRERISQMVERAGGLTDNAYLEGAKLIRRYELSEEELEERKMLMEKDSTLRFSLLDFETVSIDLVKILREPGCTEDVFMEAGDELEIPAMKNTVKVGGEVLSPSSTVYINKWKAKDYIMNSGGFSLRAKRSKTYVLYPNGSADATRSFLFFRSYPDVTPGSEVVVPKKPERNKMSAAAWVGIGSALASVSLTIVTIVNTTKN
jgi:protein involved in polysaccharide export with SLBB domain